MSRKSIVAWLASVAVVLGFMPAAGAQGMIQVEVLSGPHSVVIGNRAHFVTRVTLNGAPLEGAQLAVTIFAHGFEAGTACTQFTDADGMAICDTVPFNGPVDSYLLRFGASSGGLAQVPVDWGFAVTGAPANVVYTGPLVADMAEVPTWSARLDSAVQCDLEPCLRYAFLLEDQPVEFYLDLDNNAFSSLCFGVTVFDALKGMVASCTGWGGVALAPGAHTVFARFPGDPSDLPFWLPTSTATPITVTQAAPPAPATKDDCKGDGWRRYRAFRNQGECVSFVASGGRR